MNIITRSSCKVARNGLLSLSIAVFAFSFGFATQVVAQQDKPAVAAASEEESMAAMRQAIGEQLPDIQITSLAKTPIEGIYELISSGQIYYVSEGARFVFDGELIDLESRVNLTTERLGSIHIGLINAMEESEMLVYEPENSSAGDGEYRAITVFTDTSCGYCRKLHNELDTLLGAGIKVRYLLFPRAGIGSPAHKNLESVWCAEDPQDAMTVAKNGGSVDSRTCANPIESHMALAEQVGLRGTPLIYLDTGQQIPGYRSANELVQLINEGEPAAKN